jgi:hypothetical protein
MTYDAAHPVEDLLCVLLGMDVAVVVVVRSITVDVCMRVNMAAFVRMSMLMKVTVLMLMCMFVII